eukprot:scaffold908_cov98-Isochrysis_galbana.AAC.2
MGTVRGKKVEVCSCFPVPHTHTEEQVAVSTDFHATMLALHQRVEPGQQVVGWYSTGGRRCAMREWRCRVMSRDQLSRRVATACHLCRPCRCDFRRGGELDVPAVPQVLRAGRPVPGPPAR